LGVVLPPRLSTSLFVPRKCRALARAFQNSVEAFGRIGRPYDLDGVWCDDLYDHLRSLVLPTLSIAFPAPFQYRAPARASRNFAPKSSIIGRVRVSMYVMCRGLHDHQRRFTTSLNSRRTSGLSKVGFYCVVTSQLVSVAAVSPVAFI
jgi:hypothetical protein